MIEIIKQRKLLNNLNTENVKAIKIKPFGICAFSMLL